jgi:RNA polymerase sigma-70 factor (ECF subfamily)
MDNLCTDTSDVADQRVLRAAGGDVVAMEQLLVQAHDGLIRYLRRRLPLDLERVVDAEDILQETFKAAFVQMGALQVRNYAGFAGWLTAIARNQLHNAARSLRARKRGGGQVAMVATAAEVADANGDLDSDAMEILDLLAQNTKSPRSAVGDREYFELMRAAIEELEPDHRLALRLRFIEDLPHAQIANRLGRTEEAVRQLCFRALKRLRSLLPISAADRSRA